MRSPGAAPFYPGTSPIEAYGNGGFRFAGMSHKGSLLCLPSGIRTWSVVDVGAIGAEDLAFVLAERPPIEFLLLGSGRTLGFPPALARSALAAGVIGLEVMDTGAAARTYNILLAEGRRVGAALIAVD